jgi:prefoldin subunit 5
MSEVTDKIHALRASVDGINVEERTTRQRIQEIKSLMAELGKRKEILATTKAEETELLKPFDGKTSQEVVKSLTDERDAIIAQIALIRHNIQAIRDLIADSTKRRGSLDSLKSEEAALLKELEGIS